MGIGMEMRETFLAACPQGLQLQTLHHCLGHFQDHFVTGLHHLGHDIDEFTTDRGGITGNGQDVFQGVLFEAFEHKEAYQP
jgi:hypothetical protein